MESTLYQGHRFLDGIKAFLNGRESVEDEPRCGRPCTSKTDENVTKVRDLVWSDRRFTVRMISSVLNLNCQTVHDSEKGFIVSARDCQHLDAATRQCSLSHCHLRERILAKKLFQWFRSHHTRLIWVRVLLPFPKTQIPPLRSSFWNCGQHPKGRERPAEGTSTRRLSVLLPRVGATSPAVCSFPRELLWMG